MRLYRFLNIRTNDSLPILVRLSLQYVFSLWIILVVGSDQIFGAEMAESIGRQGEWWCWIADVDDSEVFSHFGGWGCDIRDESFVANTWCAESGLFVSVSFCFLLKCDWVERTYQINDMSMVSQVTNSHWSDRTTKTVSRNHDIVVRIFSMRFLYGVEDIISDFSPSSVVARGTETAKAEIYWHEWEI